MKKFYTLILSTLICGMSAGATDYVSPALTFTTPDKEVSTVKAPAATRSADDDDSAWTQWLDMGTVNVTYSGAVYMNINPELPILMRASTAEPEHVQYRIDGYLLSNVDTKLNRPLIIDIIDGYLYIYPQELPSLKINNSDGTPFEGKLYVTDTSTHLDMVGLRDLYEFDTDKLSFDLMLTYYDDRGNTLGTGISTELVRFNVPGWIKPPVLFSVGGNDVSATVPVEIGAAVDHYDYTIVKGGGYDDDDNFLGQRVANKDESLDIKTSSPVDPEVSFTGGEGRYTIGFATYDADGKLLSMSSGAIYYMPEDAANWQPVGKRKITDGYLVDVYGFELIPYEVELEKSLLTEGLYRVADIYGDNHPYADKIKEHTLDFPSYTYFHCEDPEACYISETPTGTVFDASGEIVLSTIPEAYFIRHGYDMDAAKNAVPGGFGKIIGGTCVFPSGSLTATSYILLEANYGWLDVGRENIMTLQIDPEAGINTVEEENSDKMAEYFNLQGIKIVNPQKGNVYIMLKDGISKKVIK